MNSNKGSEELIADLQTQMTHLKDISDNYKINHNQLIELFVYYSACQNMVNKLKEENIKNKENYQNIKKKINKIKNNMENEQDIINFYYNINKDNCLESMKGMVKKISEKTKDIKNKEITEMITTVKVVVGTKIDNDSNACLEWNKLLTSLYYKILGKIEIEKQTEKHKHGENPFKNWKDILEQIESIIKDINNPN